jgi:hypothetical protein
VSTFKDEAARRNCAQKNFIKLSQLDSHPTYLKIFFVFSIAFAYCLRYKPYKQAAPVR